MDTVEGLRSPGFTAEVDEALAIQEVIQARSGELSAMLYAEVPRLGREERRVALRVRRALHHSADPVSGADLEVLLKIAGLDPALKDLLGADDAERQFLRCRFERLGKSYPAVLARELEALAGIASEQEFRKALVVASPATSGTWEQILRKNGVLESWRLRATLLNYAMRAAGRATPNGLWAGVAMETALEQTQPLCIRRAESKVFVKPDLNIFYDLFSAAASPEHYRQAVYLRINPTLTVLNSGEYAYAVCRDGVWMIERTAGDGSTALMQQSLARGEVADFDHLRGISGLPAEEIHRLYLIGVLWPACGREAIYDDYRAALDALLACLAPQERAPWQEAVQELAAICEALQTCWSGIPVEALAEQLGRARTSVNRLAARYGAAPWGNDRNVLIFDRIAPFEISVSAQFREQLFAALREYWDFDRGGMGEALARDARASMAHNLGAASVMALAGLAMRNAAEMPAPDAEPAEAVQGSWEGTLGGIQDPGLREFCRVLLCQWTADIGPSANQHVHRVGLPAPREARPMGPGGALVVPGLTPSGMAVRIGSIAPDWGAFYGRFHHLFCAAGRNDFQHWIEQSKTWVESRGFVLADIAVRGAHDRNAALRPRAGRATLDPLGATLAGITGEFGRPGGVRLHDGNGRPVFPALHCAAELSHADPWSRWLAGLEGDASRRSLLCPQPPLARELTEWNHSPRLVLDSDVVIAPERWWCPAGITEELRARSDFDRFAAWRAWARQAGLPDRMYAQYGAAGTETVLPADSVLSVEILGRALTQSGAALRLQEMFFGEAGLWLRDENGRKFMAEIALAWTGDPMFWRP